MLDSLIQFDKEWFLFLNGLGTTSWDAFWLAITDKWTSIPVYVLLIVLSWKNFGWKGLGIILLGVALCITATDQLAQAFKYGFERLRPCYDPSLEGLVRLVKSHCGGKWSYFSAHAANSFGVVTFFSLVFKERLKWMPLFLLIWGLLVAYSRIYLGVHFPLDIITGISVGMLVGYSVYLLRNLVVKKLKL